MQGDGAIVITTYHISILQEWILLKYVYYMHILLNVLPPVGICESHQLSYCFPVWVYFAPLNPQAFQVAFDGFLILFCIPGEVLWFSLDL